MHKKLLLILLCLALIYLAFTYLLPVFLPFIIAWIIALMLQKPLRFLQNRCGVPTKISAISLVLTLCAIIFLLIFFACGRIYRELLAFSQNALAQLQNDDFARELTAKICKLFPFFDISPHILRFLSNLDTWILSLLSRLLPFFGDIVTFLPSAFLYVIMVVISSYYFAVDFQKINQFALSLLPEKAREPLLRLKNDAVHSLRQFLRAYAILTLITFAEMLLFFVIIRVKYAFLLAILVALIDFLPVFGTGVVLIPWGIVEIIGGDHLRGAAILAMFLTETLLRQIIEPKILGKYTGLSPLLMLISMYIGLRFFGIIGVIMLPMICVIAQNLLKKRYLPQKF